MLPRDAPISQTSAPVLEAAASLTDKQKKRYWYGHAAALVTLVACYGAALSELDGERELMSAAWREILGELHPDDPKDVERITESEVVPKWSEYLHADDVTKHLNWFQTFCRDKYGMDDHLEFFWQCDIIRSEARWNKGWDGLDPNMNCSERFVDKHIMQGDDPRCVPHGEMSLPYLQKLVEAMGKNDGLDKQKRTNLSKVNPLFDEYTIRHGNPMWEPAVERVDEIKGRVVDVLERLKRLPALTSLRRLFGLNSNSSRRLARRRKRRRNQRRLQQECPMAEEGCQWFPKEKRPEVEEMPCYCFNEKDFSEGTNAGTPYVLATCRNHHWGLMHLCRPDDLKVSFYIEQIKHRDLEEHLDLHTNHVRRRLVWFRVDMVFEKVVGVWDKPAGWYSARLKLSEGEFYGHKDFMDGCLGLSALLLLLWCLVRHLVFLVAYFPFRAHQLWLMRDPDHCRAAVMTARSSAVDAPDNFRRATGVQGRAVTRDIFEMRLVLLVDGDGIRARYLSVAGVCWENFAALVVTLSFSLSVFYQKSMMMPSEDESFTMITGSQYINRELSGLSRATEVLYDLFFDATASHGLAWILLYLRTVFFFLGAISGLKWLPVTIILASARSIYFMIAYSVMIVGFANVFYIQFGARFVQFSSISRASYELFLLSCGVPGYVFEDIYPWQDKDSLYTSLYLAFYMLLAITIGLNFFTTIMLDAYALAQDPEASDEVIQNGLHSISETLMKMLGIRFGESSEIDSSTEEPDRPSQATSSLRPPDPTENLSLMSSIAGDPMSGRALVGSHRRKSSVLNQPPVQRPTLFT